MLLLLLFAACGSDSESLSPDPNKQVGTLNIYVYPADDPMVTRADEGLVNAYNAENTVKSLKIWVFKHASATDTDEPLHYLAPTEPELQGSRAKLFQIALTQAQVDVLKANDGQVDLYVLANAESVGLATLAENATRAEVRDAVIASDFFGTTTLITATDLATNGLPMSGNSENISVQGTLPVLSLPVVKLTRCVSKLRFVMAQNPDADAEISINSLQLNGSLFPTTEQVFNRTDNPYSISGTYISSDTYFPPPTEVAKYDRVSELVYLSQNIQDYEDIVDEVVEKEYATQLGPYYFRESDKCLTGTVNYSITDKEDPSKTETKQASFSMSDVPGQYNFSRNHTWTVYIYYLGGEELELILAYVKNWSDGNTEHGVFNW